MNLGWDPSDRFKEVGETACTPLLYSNPPPLNTNRNFIRAQFVGWKPRKLSRSRAAQAALTARWWIFPRQSHTLQVYTEYRVTHVESIRRVQSYTQSTKPHIAAPPLNFCTWSSSPWYAVAPLSTSTHLVCTQKNTWCVHTFLVNEHLQHALLVFPRQIPSTHLLPHISGEKNTSKADYIPLMVQV